MRLVQLTLIMAHTSAEIYIKCIVVFHYQITKRVFNLLIYILQQISMLPHEVILEHQLKTFYNEVLSSILGTKS